MGYKTEKIYICIVSSMILCMICCLILHRICFFQLNFPIENIEETNNNIDNNNDNDNDNSDFDSDSTVELGDIITLQIDDKYDKYL